MYKKKTCSFVSVLICTCSCWGWESVQQESEPRCSESPLSLPLPSLSASLPLHSAPSPLCSLAPRTRLWHSPAYKRLSRCCKAPRSLTPPDTPSLFHKYCVPAPPNYLIMVPGSMKLPLLWTSDHALPSVGKSSFPPQRKAVFLQKDLSPHAPPIY